MRTRELGGFGAALVVGVALCSGTSAADPSRDDAPPPHKWGGSVSRSSWFNGMLGTQDKKQPDKELGTRLDTELPANSTTEAKPSAQAEIAAAERSREQAALLRRLAVCDQLKTVAYRTKDDALLHRAEQLEEQAQTVYSQRIAHLPASQASAPASDAPPSQYKSAASDTPNPLRASSLPGARTEKAENAAEEHKP